LTKHVDNYKLTKHVDDYRFWRNDDDAKCSNASDGYAEIDDRKS